MTVRPEGAVFPFILLMVFGLIIPTIIYGKQKNEPLIMATGLTGSIFIFGFVQFLFPLLGNVYCTAAYRYTEYGANDILTDFPLLPGKAFRSLQKEHDEEEAMALGTEKREAEVQQKDDPKAAANHHHHQETHHMTLTEKAGEVVTTDGADMMSSIGFSV